MSLVLQSDQVSTGERQAVSLASIHTDTRLKNKMRALKKHKNVLWNPIFNTKWHNELWEKLELQQETEKRSIDLSLAFFRGATAEELCLLTLLFTPCSAALFAAAIEEAHSSCSSGEKQTDSDYAVGKTKGACEFTSFCMHLQGYFTKVKPVDFIFLETSTAIRNYSEVTQQYQSVYKHSRLHNWKSTGALLVPIFFSWKTC